MESDCACVFIYAMKFLPDLLLILSNRNVDHSKHFRSTGAPVSVRVSRGNIPNMAGMNMSGETSVVIRSKRLPHAFLDHSWTRHCHFGAVIGVGGNVARCPSRLMNL
jgi:hypothetical protein